MHVIRKQEKIKDVVSVKSMTVNYQYVALYAQIEGCVDYLFDLNVCAIKRCLTNLRAGVR